jgi:membrane fusion protein (multidrug efflux system)
VRSGVKLGEQVVVAGKTALRDGSLVQVLGAPGGKSQVAGAKPATTKQ